MWFFVLLFLSVTTGKSHFKSRYTPNFWYPGHFIYEKQEYKVSFVLSRLYVLVKKTTNAMKKFSRFFKIFSRFRKDTMFLTPDLESTQNLASYRTFRGSKHSFLAKLESKNRFGRKTGFCCSLWTERCSAKTNTTTKKFIFESTYHKLESCFFLIFEIHWINHTL